MAAEDEPRLDCPVAHLRGWFLRPRDKNSSSAWATTAEIVRPDALASARTAAASRTGSLTVNTVVACGTPMRPTRRQRVDAEAARLAGLGAVLVGALSTEGPDHYAVAMKDPEGNEFDIN